MSAATTTNIRNDTTSGTNSSNDKDTSPSQQPSPSLNSSNNTNNKLTSSQLEALRRVHKIVDSFVLRNDCVPFLEPVDWRGLELFDYPTIIKKPMDLGTIKRKLERNQYISAAYCVADIRRVWSNCMTYNSVGSDFYVLAKNCSKRFEDRYRRIRNECTLYFVLYCVFVFPFCCYLVVLLFTVVVVFLTSIMHLDIKRTILNYFIQRRHW
jgi:hypothetical protein